MREIIMILPRRAKPYRQCSIKHLQPYRRKTRVDFQTIINAVQPEAIIIVLAAVLSGAGYLYQWGVQRLPANAQKIINGLAQTATQAIEQKYADNNPGGALKKQQAMDMIADMCKELGLRFNESSASAAIESAVYALNLYQKFRAPVSGVSKDTQVLQAVTTPAPAPGASAGK